MTNEGFIKSILKSSLSYYVSIDNVRTHFIMQNFVEDKLT